MTFGPRDVVAAVGTVGYARVRLSKLLMRSAYGAVLASLVPFGLTIWSHKEQLVFVGLFALAASFGLTVASYVVWFLRGARPGRVEIDAESLIVDDTSSRVIPRARILSAAVVERALGGAPLPYVEIDLTNGDRISVGVPAGEEVARALVAELGFGPGARRVRFDLAAPTRRLFHPLIGFGAYQIPNVFLSIAAAILGLYFLQMLSLPIMIVAYVLIRRAIKAPVVTVGDDGLVWESGFKKRFIARQDIVGVEQVHASAPVTISILSGPDIVLGGAAIDVQRSTAVGRAIRERFGHARAGEAIAGVDRAAYFARGARSVADWRAALSGRLDASYRAPSASLEDMTSVLTSASATPEERIGAALALRVAGEAPVRIRVAAESVVSEPLREALTAAADDDDAKLDVMLRRMSTQSG